MRGRPLARAARSMRGRGLAAAAAIALAAAPAACGRRAGAGRP
jgi:hypothetical protein